MQKYYEQNIETAVMKWYIDHGYNNIFYLLNDNISETNKIQQSINIVNDQIIYNI